MEKCTCCNELFEPKSWTNKLTQSNPPRYVCDFCLLNCYTGGKCEKPKQPSGDDKVNDNWGFTLDKEYEINEELEPFAISLLRHKKLIFELEDNKVYAILKDR